MICAEWIDYDSSWRIYDDEYPNWTIAYEDEIEVAKDRVRMEYGCELIVKEE